MKRFLRHLDRAPLFTGRFRCAPYLAAILSLASIHGCATSPRTHFYTLSHASVETAARRAPHTQAPFYIEITAIEIPATVARTQLVITDRSGTVNVKEQHRWLAPLDDQIRAALSEELMSRLHTLDVSQIPHASDRPVYRIAFNVQRFESRLDAPAAGHALIEAIWSVRRIDEKQRNGRTALTCRVSVHESSAADLYAVSQGHRRAIGRIAHQIAAVIRTLDAARIDSALATRECPALAPLTQ